MALPPAWGLLSCGSPSSRPSGHRRARGLTLVEMLISVALTLLIVLAIVRVFDMLGGNVTESRSILEMSAQLRSAAHQLQQDLDHATAPLLPPLDPGASLGYVEIVEGIVSDRTTSVSSNLGETVLGDADDVLLLTVRSAGQPFLGRFNGQRIESREAEVIWWVHVDANGRRTLHRRQLLIRPDLNPQLALFPVNGLDQFLTFFQQNDLSVRPAAGRVIANTLADLTIRENRFGHWDATLGASYPAPLNGSFLLPRQTPFQGEDVVLTDLLAFDLKVYDPLAPVLLTADRPYALVPSDPGYVTPTSPIASGSYVDLGYGQPLANPPVSHFSMGADPRSGLASLPERVYCTWSTSYQALPANNGLDDDGNGLVDDPAESSTAPPYQRPLRGIEVTLRMHETSSRNVRQVSVVSDFTPN